MKGVMRKIYLPIAFVALVVFAIFLKIFDRNQWNGGTVD
jgi:ABC-type glycerol-3-phosphate transport system permease component